MMIARARSLFLFSALSLMTVPAEAGSYGGSRSQMSGPAPSMQAKPLSPSVSSTAGTGFASDQRAGRSDTGSGASVIANGVLVPVGGGTGGLPAFVPRVALHGENAVASPIVSAPLSHPRRVEPGSFVPLDPRAVISETPSGRIFMGAPAGVYPVHAVAEARARTLASGALPAQPRFIMIGGTPSRDMRGPVHMSYGVAPRGNPGPQVVWLKQEPIVAKY